ncbi:O-antigen ligase family protein [Hymenobacter sp. GOD-10R]|uniref:O-antigen ligase family protein n=1 Tax=Hymenobacter sp. GOD-10R TaxID=3093922 RepID=UPI002D792A25|nr:O-antigen ligase family protein [Hymenobacter sp. GOD-10R]WRQ30346.1 O-antigen ligase family protein [Hymenobacter sp. GOD-10R]
MGEGKITYVLAGATIIAFLFFFHRKREVRTYLLFSIYVLPFMNLLVTKVTWGGFKVFDAITIYCIVFCFKDFMISIASSRSLVKFLLITMLALLLLSSLYSEFVTNSTLTFLELLPLFIYVSLLAAECRRDEFFFYKVIKALKYMYVVALGFLLIQLVVGLNFTFYPDLNSNTLDVENNTIRYPGMFHDSQGHGQFLALGSFLFLFSHNNYRGEYKNIVNYSLFVLLIIGLLLTGSRSALGGFLVALIIFVVSSSSKFRLYFVALCMICVSLFSTLASEFPNLRRLNNVSEDYKFRQKIWAEAYRISENNPVLGIGLGNFQSYTKRHNQDLYLEIGEEILFFDQPESGYLKILSETGFFSFLLFLLLIAYCVIRAIKKCVQSSEAKVSAVLLCSLVSWLIAFNTVYTLFDIRISIVVITIMVILATISMNKYFVYESSK